MPAWQAMHWGVALGLLTLLFAFTYKVLPEVVIPWRASRLAGIARHGRAVQARQHRHRAVPDAQHDGFRVRRGGSLVVVLAWVYYSSQVVLFGAELTEAYARPLAFSVTTPVKTDAVATPLPVEK